MAITVNGVEITDAMIAAETENHGYAPNPREAAIQQLILHQLLLQQARAKGLTQEEENLAIASLLDQELQFTHWMKPHVWLSTKATRTTSNKVKALSPAIFCSLAKMVTNWPTRYKKPKPRASWPKPKQTQPVLPI